MIKEKISVLADLHAERLQKAIDGRTIEMETDDVSHYLIYQVLGIAETEGRLIDLYQNKGRFLYNYAGSFLEKATRLCFKEIFPESGAIKIPNAPGQLPKTFEIDCLVGRDAIEVKWKHATTDGDHLTKEHARIKVISHAGYKPIRVMFYYPNRARAIRIQEALATLYRGLQGEYYYGNSAWDYVKQRTKVDLKAILEEIATERKSATI